MVGVGEDLCDLHAKLINGKEKKSIRLSEVNEERGRICGRVKIIGQSNKGTPVIDWHPSFRSETHL